MGTYRVRACYPWVGEESALRRHAEQLLDGLQLQPALIDPRVETAVEHTLAELPQPRVEFDHGVVETTVSIEAHDGFDATHQVLLAHLAALRHDPTDDRPTGDRHSSDTVLVFAHREDVSHVPEPSPAPVEPGQRRTPRSHLDDHGLVITRHHSHPRDPEHRRAG